MAAIDTIAAGTRIENEIKIKRSRFVTTLARTDSSSEARALINEVKAANPQARHNCSAFLIRVPDMSPEQRSSDDGEPAGTAGTPMLEALRQADVWNVTAVVTRYFGGILLGGGGLVRAYSSSVSQALALAPRAHLIALDVLDTSVDLVLAGRVEAELRRAGAHILDTQWGTDLTLRVGIPEGDRSDFDILLAEITSGVSQFHISGKYTIQIDGAAPRS